MRDHLTVVEDPPGYTIPRFDLDMYQGDDFELLIDVVDGDGMPVDLTGRTVRSQIRRSPGAVELAAEFDVDLTNAATGRAVLTLGNADTAPLVGVYRYDVKWNDPTPIPADPDGMTSFFATGSVTVDAEVTR